MRISLLFSFLRLIINNGFSDDLCGYQLQKKQLAIDYCQEYAAVIERDAYCKPGIPGNFLRTAILEWRTDPHALDFDLPYCIPITCDGSLAIYAASIVSGLSVLKICTQPEIPISFIPPIIKSVQNNDAQCRTGSIIETSNQVLGETIPLTGLPFYLAHFSNRTLGKKGDYLTKFALTAATISPRISNFTVNIEDDNHNLISTEKLSASPNMEYTYQWDGKVAGVETWGAIKRKIIIKTEVTSGSPVDDAIFELSFGNLKSKKLGLGGWLPSLWHFYDFVAEKIYNGDGSSRNVKGIKDGAYTRVASSDGGEVYYFDSIGRIAKIKTGLTGALVYLFQYRTDEKLFSITDAHNKIIHFNYNTSGDIAEIVSSENIKTFLTTDANGYLKTVKNSKSEVYTMTYNDLGGLLASYSKPNSNIAYFSYDIEGNLLLDRNSSGYSSTLTKSDEGIKATSRMGRVTQNNYNKAQSTETEIRPSGLSTVFKFTSTEDMLTKPYATSKIIYQDDLRFGSQVKVATRLENSNFGSSITNISNEVNLNDSNDPFSIDSISKIITEGNSEFVFHYDGLTRTNTLTSKLGRSIARQIDSLERPILERTGDLAPVKYKYVQDKMTEVSQGDRRYNFTYNPQTKLLQSIKNSEDETVKFSYDEAQRLKSKTLPDGRIINYVYDSNGNLLSLVPPGRPAHRQTYGANEMLNSYNPPALPGIPSVNTSYTYNLDRELTKITRPDGVEINFNFNQVTGLLDSISGDFGTFINQYVNELLVKTIDSKGASAEFDYTGNVVSKLTIKDQNQTGQYSYQRSPLENSNELIKTEILSVGNQSQTINYNYDDDKFLIEAGEMGLAYNIPNGNLKETTLQNIKEEYTYNNFGEISTYKAYFLQGVAKKLLYAYTLKRDKIGRIIKKSESFGKHEEKKHKHHFRSHDHDEKINTEYSYDKAGRLVRARVDERTNSIYFYDQNSNRIRGFASGNAFVSVYDNQDRLIRYNDQVYTYNANGELLSKAKKNKKNYITTNYDYDVFGNLKRAGNVTYTIDPLQRRNAKLIDGKIVKKYAYSPEGRLIGEMDKDGNLLKTFIYGTKSHVPDYFVDQNNELFKLIVDQLGSLRFVVKTSTGEIVQKMNHDEFGKVLEDSNPGLTPFGFAGGLYDAQTKLVRFGVRDYDPETGRWLSKDPIRFNGGDTNLYGYVLQDPVNLIDPEGLAGYSIPEAGLGDFLKQLKDALDFKKKLNDLQDKLLCKINPKLCEGGKKPDQNPFPPDDPTKDNPDNKCNSGGIR